MPAAMRASRTLRSRKRKRIVKKFLAIAALLVWAAPLAIPFGAHAQEGTSTTATGISRALNPAISVNTLLLGRVSRDDPSREANTIDLQEMEVQFTSIVDPFWTADLVLAVHPEHGHEEEGHEGEGAHGYALDVEVARVEYRNMPRNLGLVLGKDYLNFGKHNPLHTHQFAFVEAPIGVRAFLGDHGLSGVGAEAAWNVPLPWFAELSGYAAASKAEIFDHESRDLVYGGRLSNLWDTSDASTIEFGLSALTGPGAGHEEEPGGRLGVYGADLTFKWLSMSRTQGPALTWTNEVILPDPEEKEGDPRGLYSHLQYRFARQWWFGAGYSRADDFEMHHHGEGEEEEEHGLMTVNEYKGNFTWTPSEFSAVRFEVWYQKDTTGEYEDLGAGLQVNFTIGSHPAHLY
jgi:hypothetical protein